MSVYKVITANGVDSTHETSGAARRRHRELLHLGVVSEIESDTKPDLLAIAKSLRRPGVHGMFCHFRGEGRGYECHGDCPVKKDGSLANDE